MMLKQILLVSILLVTVSTPVIETQVKRTGGTSSKASLAVLRDSSNVQAAKRELSQLGYWVGPDSSLRFSLTAFQKIEGRAKTGQLTGQELEALRCARRPEPLERNGNHIEVDLRRQVLFFVGGDGTVSNILPISSGSGKLFTERGTTRRAVTPTGNFTVIRKIRGMHKSPLGLLYYPNFILEGIAIHGNGSVPAYPASHGCIRIPNFAAVEFSNLTPVGTRVIVYNSRQ
jgi:hypothetical protein